jgi:hypothetical protein
LCSDFAPHRSRAGGYGARLIIAIGAPGPGRIHAVPIRTFARFGDQIGAAVNAKRASSLFCFRHFGQAFITAPILASSPPRWTGRLAFVPTIINPSAPGICALQKSVDDSAPCSKPDGKLLGQRPVRGAAPYHPPLAGQSQRNTVTLGKPDLHAGLPIAGKQNRDRGGQSSRSGNIGSAVLHGQFPRPLCSGCSGIPPRLRSAAFLYLPVR